MRKEILYIIGIIILSFLTVKCYENDDVKSKYKEREGRIIGFDPCTISHHYPIGYVIVTSDLKDTLISYNISDKDFKMPASVLLMPSDTIYTVPESNFENYGSTFLFPQDEQEKFKIKFEYADADGAEKVYNLCITDVMFLDFKQIVVKSISTR